MHTIKTSGLQSIVQAFSIIEDMIFDLNSYHLSYSIENSTKMDKLLKSKKKSTVDVEDWISEVVWDEGLSEED
ncbi:hypothetical protein MFLAVUS_001358 [Mucor flavus]|uniref:Uncharacterized protein n=1 Tax=Mucor flavus TaxID=439312 RepID=A0ABP9YMB3_9FUNG